MNGALLDLVFGTESAGLTEYERARTSRKVYVRSQLQLAEDNGLATGRKMSALEVLNAYGIDALKEVAENGYSLLVNDRSEPARTIRQRREALGLTIPSFSKAVGITQDEIKKIESAKALTSSHVLDRISVALAIDERYLGMDRNDKADAALGVRFRDLSASRSATQNISASSGLKLLEAAWVINRQAELSETVGEDFPVRGQFRPTPDYAFPTYERGYALAERTRSLLGLEPEEPINSLRQLVEKRLGIPLIEIALDTRIAGATLANGTRRGIVANTQGENENPWVRRMTMAHELAHLLWDPDQKLGRLLIDSYDQMHGNMDKDPVESRANAFAVAFLAPSSAVKRIAQKNSNGWSGLVELCQTYGISRTAGRYHMQNICKMNLDQDGDDPIVSDEWRSQEDRGNAYFAIRETGDSRRGRFAFLVMKAFDRGFISDDTAAHYLQTSRLEVSAKKEVVLDLNS